MIIYFVYKPDYFTISPSLWELGVSETQKLYHIQTVRHIAGCLTRPGYIQLKKDDRRIHTDKTAALKTYIEGAQDHTSQMRELWLAAGRELEEAQDLYRAGNEA